MPKKKVEWTTIESLISWLNYKKLTGHTAARYEPEQEEYWAKLVLELVDKCEKQELQIAQLLSKIKHTEEALSDEKIKEIISQ